MFSGKHHLDEIDGNPFLDRDPETFKLVISYLRNDCLDLEIQDPLQKQLFDKEVKFWDLNNMYDKLDDKLVKMMNSTPKINEEWTDLPLVTWHRLGALDLNEVNDKNPIHLNNAAEYQEVERDYGFSYGQRKGNNMHGIGRYVGSKDDDDQYKNYIEEGQFENGQKNGYCRVINSSGNYEIGFYKNDKRHGKGKYFNADGTLYEEWEYIDGKRVE